MIEAGQHKVKVISSAITKASTGNYQIAVTFENADGDTIDAFLAVTDKAWPYTEEKLKRLGYDVDANDLNIMKLNAGDLSPIVGKETQITVVEDSYGGRATLKVDRIGSSGGAAPMDNKDAKAFSDALRQKLIAAGRVPTKKRPV